MARISLEIDEKACAEVMRRYGLKTKKEAINFALRCMAGKPTSADPAEAMTIEEALAMEGFGWDGGLDEMRSSRLP